MSSAPKFHKIDSGLYGTGIWETKERGGYFHCRECCDIEYEGGEVQVEWVIDRYSSEEPGWDLRLVCEHRNFLSLMGGWYPTLREAKDDIIEGALS